MRGYGIPDGGVPLYRVDPPLFECIDMKGGRGSPRDYTAELDYSFGPAARVFSEGEQPVPSLACS
jgi:hypothetical protein